MLQYAPQEALACKWEGGERKRDERGGRREKERGERI
jgi:hypothetical protein